MHWSQKNSKALYLKAKALLASEKFPSLARQEAVDTLEQVVEAAPNNEEAKALLETAKAEMEARGSALTLKWVWFVLSTAGAWALVTWIRKYGVPTVPVQGADGGWMRGDDVDINIGS